MGRRLRTVKRMNLSGESTTVTSKLAGIRPEDNEAGTQSSLEKLARYVEEEAGR